MLRVEALAAWESRRREEDAARMERELEECKRANNLAVRAFEHYPEAVYWHRQFRAPVVTFDGGLTRLALRGHDTLTWYVVWECCRCGELIVGHTPVRDKAELGRQIESGPSEEDLAEHGCAVRTGRPLSEYLAAKVV